MYGVRWKKQGREREGTVCVRDQGISQHFGHSALTDMITNYGRSVNNYELRHIHSVFCSVKNNLTFPLKSWYV